MPDRSQAHDVAPRRLVVAGVGAFLVGSVAIVLAAPYIVTAEVEAASAVVVVVTATGATLVFISALAGARRRLLEAFGLVTVLLGFIGAALLIEDVPRRVPLGIWAAGLMLAIGVFHVASGIRGLNRRD